MLPYILVLSILLQIASAVTALVLIVTSGFYRPWLLISAAVTLMAVRRIISYTQMIQAGVFPDSAYGPELIALLISILMLLGLLYFAPAFSMLRKQTEQALMARELLVRESHHHVKNDLQLLQSLVSLQQNATETETEKRFLKDLELRIHSFSLLHEYIYNGERSGISFRDYISYLAMTVSQVYNTGAVRLQLDLTDIPVSNKNLLHCGLIVNEALTNAFKYAFLRPESDTESGLSKNGVDRSEPVITISNCHADGRAYLSISDNGIGLPSDVIDGFQGSYGLTLIRGIGNSPGWQITIQTRSGTTIEASFPAELEPDRPAL